MSTNELLRAHFDKLRAERAAALEATQVYRNAVNEVEAKIQTLRDSIKDEREALKLANVGLAKMDDEISRLALALGGKRLSDS
jgi:uncharacterized coiled-coil DUF342 family protein